MTGALNTELATPARMPLAHARDALSDCVDKFHNEMLRRGVTELPPDKWVDEFRDWLPGFDMDRHYAEVRRWLDETSGTSP